jgi:hypothetical protein
MTNPICELMEGIDELCKRCYHLQKSNNDMYGKILLMIKRFHLIFLEEFRLHQRRSTNARIYQ